MRPRQLLILTTLLALALASCADEESGDGDPGPATGVGPGISVEQALELETGEPVLVNGFLVVDTDGEVTLASSLAESMPPQPGGATLTVEGVDFDDYELIESQGVRWTDEIVQVLGTVEGDTLVVSMTASG